MLTIGIPLQSDQNLLFQTISTCIFLWNPTTFFIFRLNHNKKQVFCGALPLPAWISRRNRAATMRIHIREPSNSICVCCCAFDLRVKRAFHLPLVAHRGCAHTPSDHHPQTPVDPEVRKVGLSNGFDLVGTPVASRLGSLALSTYVLLSGLSALMAP